MLSKEIMDIFGIRTTTIDGEQTKRRGDEVCFPTIDGDRLLA